MAGEVRHVVQPSLRDFVSSELAGVGVPVEKTSASIGSLLPLHLCSMLLFGSALGLSLAGYMWILPDPHRAILLVCYALPGGGADGFAGRVASAGLLLADVGPAA